MSEEAIVVTTTARGATARRIAEDLVKQRLAACVQASEVSSTYEWRGRVECETEILLTIKTRRALYPQVEAAIRALHDYETPEIIATLAVEGSVDYLGWIAQATGEREGGGQS